MTKSIESRGFSGNPNELGVRLVTLSDTWQMQRAHLSRAARELGITFSPSVGGPLVNPSDMSLLRERATQIRADMRVPWDIEALIPEGFIDKDSAAAALNLSTSGFDRLALKNSLPRVMIGGKSYTSRADIEKIKNERESKRKKKPTESGK